MFTRNFGLRQAAERQASLISDEDREILEAFSLGINTCAQNVKVWPIEFYIMWADFKPWEPKDTVGIHMLMALFLSLDHPFEIVRHKLSKIYDWDTVSKFYPWKAEDVLLGDGAVLLDDEHLKQYNLFADGEGLYDVPDELLAIPTKDGKRYTEEQLKSMRLRPMDDGSIGSFSGPIKVEASTQTQPT